MKRIMAVMLALCMLIAAGVVSYAEEEDKGLTNAILSAKRVVDISEEYKNFKYDYYENEEMGQRAWQLKWYTEYPYDGVGVTVLDDGTFLAYEKRIEETEENVLSNITQSEGLETAMKFLEKVFPNEVKDFKQAEKHVSVWDRSFEYYFQRYMYDVPVAEETVTIDVDKYTGEVSNYSGCLLHNGDYPPPEDIISRETAKQKYLENLGIRLQYELAYDYEKKTITPYLAYVSSSNEAKAINAYSGEATDYFEGYMSEFSKASANEAKSEIGGEDRLTSIEQQAVNTVTGLISKEKAIEAVLQYAPFETEGYSLNASRLSPDFFYEDEFIWYIYVSCGGEENRHEISGTVDAATGNVLQFRTSRSISDSEEAIVSEETARLAADEFLKGMLGEETFSSLVYEKVNDAESVIIAPKNILSDLMYTRYVNGTPVRGQGVSVVYDRHLGKITGFDIEIDKHLEFLPTDTVMSEKDVFEEFARVCKFKLIYKNADKTEKGLYYDFEEKANMRFDAVTGQQIDYNGNPVIKDTIPKYYDIKGHWCEEIVQRLLENGIYIPNTTTFDPAEEITQYDFLRYLMTQQYNNVTKEDFYKNIIRRGIIKEEEQNPAGAVTRQEAVVYVIRLLGYEKVARYNEIYKYPFGDEITEEYKGYVSLAYALKIIKGDESGLFNASNTLTKAEAAMIVHNTLIV